MLIFRASASGSGISSGGVSARRSEALGGARVTSLTVGRGRGPARRSSSSSAGGRPPPRSPAAPAGRSPLPGAPPARRPRPEPRFRRRPPASPSLLLPGGRDPRPDERRPDSFDIDLGLQDALVVVDHGTGH